MSGGIIGIIANDFARASLFTACIFKLDVPDGWQKEMLIGGDWCSARNDLCRVLLNSEHEYLWFMDDDHAFPRSFLKKLLVHEKDLVMPICLTRTHPFAPVQYTTKVGPNQYLPIPLSDTPTTKGLVECEAGGTAGMLIHRKVIEAIEEPWFEYSDRSEDIIFCEKAKAAGFTLWADLNARLGHITTAVVHPTVRAEDWMVALTIGQSLNLVIDTADTVVSEESPGAPAQVQTWIWELRRVVDDDTVSVMLLPAGVPFNWQPGNGHAPSGVFQWYCDEGAGEGPKPVGDAFSYREGI